MLVIGEMNAFELPGEEVLELAGHPVVGNEQTVVVRETDEMAVEEPMACSG